MEEPFVTAIDKGEEKYYEMVLSLVPRERAGSDDNTLHLPKNTLKEQADEGETEGTGARNQGNGGDVEIHE